MYFNIMFLLLYSLNVTLLLADMANQNQVNSGLENKHRQFTAC